MSGYVQTYKYPGLLLTFLLLSGCLTHFPIEPRTAPADLRANGIVVGSFEEISESDLPMSSHFFIRDVLTNEVSARVSSDDFTQDNKEIQFPSTEKYRGGVFVLELPPGVYTFSNFNIVTYAASAYRSSKLNFGRIRVKANQVSYIGSLDLYMSPGKNALGMNEFISNVVGFQDEYSRDVNLIRKNFPFLKNKEIKNQTIQYKSSVM